MADDKPSSMPPKMPDDLPDAARRQLLKVLAYSPPAILGAMVMPPLGIVGSCAPTTCNPPNGCPPTGTCNPPANCNPNTMMM